MDQNTLFAILIQNAIDSAAPVDQRHVNKQYLLQRFVFSSNRPIEHFAEYLTIKRR